MLLGTSGRRLNLPVEGYLPVLQRASTSLALGDRLMLAGSTFSGMALAFSSNAPDAVEVIRRQRVPERHPRYTWRLRDHAHTGGLQLGYYQARDPYLNV